MHYHFSAPPPLISSYLLHTAEGSLRRTCLTGDFNGLNCQKIHWVQSVRELYGRYKLEFILAILYCSQHSLLVKTPFLPNDCRLNGLTAKQQRQVCGWFGAHSLGKVGSSWQVHGKGWEVTTERQVRQDKGLIPKTFMSLYMANLRSSHHGPTEPHFQEWF